MTPPWQDVLAFWFPPSLATAEPAVHRAQFDWWFSGGSTPHLARFAATATAAQAGALDAWAASPRGRLALLLALDQLPRGLHPGQAAAYAGDAAAKRLAEDALRNGHYAALSTPWERLFVLIAFGHLEGPDHLARFDRIATLTEALVESAPLRLRPLYAHNIAQVARHRAVIARFGRYPHRNVAMGRDSTPEEAAYIAAGDFPHLHRPPAA